MKFILKNIQSIVNAAYDLPDYGLVQIVGPNSNGKSILIKAVNAVTSLKILDESYRASLIRDGESAGSISMSYNGKMLIVHLNRDRMLCSVTLVREDGEKVIRNFREKGIAELISEFGFICFDDNNLCLQVFETFGQMPFVNTSNKVNDEIVKRVTEDPGAQKFLENYKTVTHKIILEQHAKLKEQIESRRRLRSSMVMFDHERYQASYEKMKKLYEELKCLDVLELDFIQPPPMLEVYEVPEIELDEIPIVPRVDIIDVDVPTLQFIAYKDALSIPENIESLEKDVDDINTILDGKCPTCGKTLVEV